MTALMLAAEIKQKGTVTFRQHLDIIENLIDKKADVNLHNRDEYTALILAAEIGNKEVVDRLLNVEGIEIDAKNKFGKTALILSSENGHLEVVKLLKEHGANVLAVSKIKRSSLMLAAVKGHESIVKYLIQFPDTVLQRETTENDINTV
jgi:ankyrin repeat protein